MLNGHSDKNKARQKFNPRILYQWKIPDLQKLVYMELIHFFKEDFDTVYKSVFRLFTTTPVQKIFLTGYEPFTATV